MRDAADQLEALRNKLAALRAALGAPAVAPAEAQRAARLEHLTALCTRYTGDGSHGVAAHSIANPGELSHFANNPVPRPPMACRPGDPYPIGSTAWGQSLAASLGVGSGFYQEVCN